MTKPAVWVQFIIKKNNGGENNLLHLKYPTCRKLWLFLFCNYKDLRSQIVLSYPYPQLRLICGSFEFRSNYGKSMEVDLHGSQSEKWDGVRTNFYLTEEDLKVFYNLKDIPMKALKVESNTGWFGWIQS